MKNIELFRKLFPRIISISLESTADISQSVGILEGKILQVRDITDPNRHVVINFDLNGKLRSIELGTELLGTEIKILERSFDGKFYVYFGNCRNLTPSHKGVYSYYDYYNQEIHEDSKTAKVLVSLMMTFLKGISKIKYKTTCKIIFVSRKIKNNKIVRGKALTGIPSNLIQMLKNAHIKYSWKILSKEGSLLREVYSTPVNVLPPEVRPDQNPIFSIIQITQGCWLQSVRGPCKFCSSFRGISYREKSIEELKNHVEQVKKFTGKGWPYVKKIFLSDADPLKTKIDSEIYLKSLAKMAPNAVWYEAFISTPTILSKSVKQWKRLKNLGLKKLYWGVESADDITLKVLGKAHNKKSLYAAALRLNKARINYVAIVMSGISFLNSGSKDPKNISDRPHLKATAKFIHDCKCPVVYISRFTPQPNTDVFNLIKNKVASVSVEEKEVEHRIMVKMISYNNKNVLIPNREVRGTYGVQFV